MHLNSLMMFQKYVYPLMYNGMSVFEIGPASTGFKPYWEEQGMKIEYEYTDLNGWDRGKPGFIKCIDAEHYDVPNNRYDMVLSGSVIEHVARPWMWIKENARMVKSGGLVAVLAPMTWDIHGREPYDCWRILPDGMSILMLEAGLTPLAAASENLCGDMDKSGQFSQGLCFDVIGLGRKP